MTRIARQLTLLCALMLCLSFLALAGQWRMQWAAQADARLEETPAAPADLFVIVDQGTAVELYRWRADGTEVLAPGVTRAQVRLWLWQATCRGTRQCA